VQTDLQVNTFFVRDNQGNTSCMSNFLAVSDKTEKTFQKKWYSLSLSNSNNISLKSLAKESKTLGLVVPCVSVFA